MKLTTIQLREDTKKIIEKRKKHPRESYDAVLQRILKEEEIPSMKEMFAEANKIKQDKICTKEEVVEMIRKRRDDLEIH